MGKFTRNRIYYTKAGVYKNVPTPINSLLLSHSDTHCSEFLFHVFTHLKKTNKPPEWHPFQTENQVNILNSQIYIQ